jgi:U3 small nucleolar RNA-associated protein 4
LSLQCQNDAITPKRIRDFSSILRSNLPTSTPGTGGSAFAFSPDGTKLIMTSCTTSCILIIDLGNGESPRVLRQFDHHLIGPPHLRRIADSLRANGSNEFPEARNNDGETRNGQITAPVATVLRIAVSMDGQWVATSDDLCQTRVFNLDSLQARLFRFHWPLLMLCYSIIVPFPLLLSQHMHFHSTPPVPTIS